MRHPDELRPEPAELERARLGIELAELGGAQQPVLVELRLDEPERQAGCPDLVHGNLAEQVRQRADVILVGVGEDDRAHRPPAIAQVREVREDQVDAEVLVAREREPGVDDDRIVAVLVDGHVLADLAEAAERNDSHRFGHRRSLGAKRLCNGGSGSRAQRRRRSSASSFGLASEIAAPGLARRFPRRRSVDGERRRDGDVVRSGVVLVQLDDVRTRLHLRRAGRVDITLRLAPTWRPGNRHARSWTGPRRASRA